MPCYTISTIEIDAGKLQTDLALAALAAMSLRPYTAQNTQQDPTIYHSQGTYNPQTGVATWRGIDRTADLKRAYSAEIIKSQAQRFGWNLKQDERTGKYVMQKR
jgi:hypothetical protein